MKLQRPSSAKAYQRWEHARRQGSLGATLVYYQPAGHQGPAIACLADAGEAYLWLRALRGHVLAAWTASGFDLLMS